MIVDRQWSLQNLGFDPYATTPASGGEPKKALVDRKAGRG